MAGGLPIGGGSGGLPSGGGGGGNFGSLPGAGGSSGATGASGSSMPPAFGGGGSRDVGGGSQSSGMAGNNIWITRVTVNNVQYNAGDVPIEVPFASPIINWAYATTNVAIKQVGYEVRVGTHKVNWGGSGYMPDVYRLPFTRSPAAFWRFKEKHIGRGTIYYGQIRLTDNSGSVSGWTVFSFKVNRQPRVTSAVISPKEPSVTNDLSLAFKVSEQDSFVFIRWFRNGQHQTHLDNYEKVSRDYLRYKDVWLAEITPFDLLETGPAFETVSVMITKMPPVAQSLEVLPRFATDQDILSASYVVSDPNVGSVLLDDRSKIRWFVNGFLIENANDAKSVRLATKPGDEVFFTLTPSDGVFDGESVSSDVRIINDVGFRISNLRVDGQSDNINVSTVNPTVEWNVIEPFRRFSRFASVEIGTSPGANNIFSAVVETFEEKYVIPDNVVERGIDYYITVAASDSKDLFFNKTTTHFRAVGARWEESVTNENGWTIELAVQIEGIGYQYISVADGKKFAQVRFFTDSIHLMLGAGNIKSFSLDMTSYRNIIIVGQGDTIKVYDRNNLALDGEHQFLTESSGRFIEVGSPGDSSAVGFFKRIVYTTKGAFFPDTSTEYSNMALQVFSDFSGRSIDAICEHEGDILAAANPHDNAGSGVIYKIVETEQPRLISTENVDKFAVELHSVSSSYDEKIVYFGHSKGASGFYGYHIPRFDTDSRFLNGATPERDLWELVQTTPFLAASYNEDGLIIDTTFSNTARIDDREHLTPQAGVAAITLRYMYDVDFAYDFYVTVTGANFVIQYVTSGASPATATDLIVIPLEGSTVQDICDAVNSETGVYLKYVIEAIPLNECGNQSARHLDAISQTKIFPSFTLAGTFSVPDPLNPNPYSYAAGGKWFYTHRKHGTPWFEKVSNEKGWTVDFEATVDHVEDSDRPSDVEDPEGLGLYVNDGSFYENLTFLPQEIVLGGSGRSVLYDTTTFTKYRVVGKGSNLKVYAKKNGELYYQLLSESELKTAGTNQGNGGRPVITQASNGALHAVWHDDGNNSKRQLYYSYFDPNTGSWSNAELIVKDEFGAANPDIAVDGFGNVYVVFETMKTDYSDIAVTTKNNLGWSEPYAITNGIGASISPRVAVDDSNNVHVVWEDYRLTEPEIYYCRRNAADGQWVSSAFSSEDIRVSDAASGAHRPSITALGLNVYVSWTVGRLDGTTGISVGYYNAGSKVWLSSGQGKFDFIASASNSLRADFSDIIADKKGRIFVVYHDLVGKNYQIMARRSNSLLTVSADPTQLTTGEYDSRFPRVGMNESAGDLYVVFEKEQDKVVDAYVPYSNEQEETGQGADIFIVRYNAIQQVWESSNQTTVRQGTTYGGFDVHVIPPDGRVSHRPSLCRKYSGEMHVLYEAEIAKSHGVVAPNRELFVLVRDAVFDHTFEAAYVLGEESQSDPYLGKDQDLSGDRLRKEIRFGDFSNSVGSRFVVGRISYYLSDAVDPFNIKLLSSATLNMPSSNVYSIKANNRGDAFLGTDQGLMFFDRSKDRVFVYDNEDTGIADRTIYDIAADQRGNLYLATDDGVFTSHDHVYFWKITGDDMPASALNVEVDSRNHLFVGSASGLVIVSTGELVETLKSTSGNYQTSRSIAAKNTVKVDVSNGLPSNAVNVVRVDANNVAWVGTDKGLVRYKDGKSFVFNRRHGLASDKVLDVAIRNTAIRYIASTSGIDKMIGVNIERLDFDNINAPIASLVERSTAEINVPNFNNARAILWKDPNLLFVCSVNDIYQITFVDEQFYTEQTQITKFDSANYAMIKLDPVQNDDMKTFRLVGIDDIDLAPNKVFEVYLNGKAISNGYKFSAKHKIIRFDYPLNKYDVVQVNVRFDIEKFADFSQNKAQQIAVGNKSTKVKELLSSNHNAFALTGGDINTIQINDLENDLPFDSIILDTHPPVGKIRIGEQLDQTVVRVHIDRIDPYTPFDATSGVDTMIVSNFTNFTDDGEIPQDDIPFVTPVSHDLGMIFQEATRQLTFPEANGSAIGRWDKPGNTPTMFAGLSSPARIYGFDPIDEEWTLRATLDEDSPNASVNFITSFNGLLIVGTGSDTGIGKIYRSTDGENFDHIANLPVKHARCAEIHNNLLYIGGSGDEGRLISFDGDKLGDVFSGISGGIYDLVSAGGVLYAATGEEGRIYRLDPQNSTQQIVHVDSDTRFLSIGAATVGGVRFVFAGTSVTARIVRQRLPSSAFTHSFKTISAPVYAINEIGGKVYASIGKTLFVLDGVWQSRYTHSEDIIGFTQGPDGAVWFVSANYIYKVEDIGATRNVYLKMTDKAGNATNLYLDKARTKLDPNLYDSVNIADLRNFVNKNRIIEVNEVGDTVFSYNGEDRFYSADRVDDEIGIYYSEIFNGNNNLVSWDKISWDSTVPSNTDLKIYVRTGNNRDDVLDADFRLELENDESPANISFLSGQYLQFKVVMTSRVRGLSPSLRKVVVKAIDSQATHFFTTNFMLPSRVKSGILTSQKMIPVAADIVFGIDTMNTTDFGDYQIIDENRIFTTDDRQIGNNLRVGIRLITPSRGEVISEEFGEYGPYNTPLAFNSLEWSYTNASSDGKKYDFRVSFYEDPSQSLLVYNASTQASVLGFSADGELFPDGGFSIGGGQTGTFSFTPVGDNPIKCNTFYFVKIEINDGGGWVTISDLESFVEACGTTFVDTIDFDFQNDKEAANFHFRVRFYDDAERTNLVLTAYSGNDQHGWSVDDEPLPIDGVPLEPAQSAVITFSPDPSNFERGTTYYLSIDAFDGSKFATHSNSFTFRVQNIESDIYCGEYREVPVVKNFAIMFELEGGQFVTLRLED